MRVGGSGPPLVCLHGYPQSHLTWRKVAPLLADRYTVVLPDLRGYGASEIVASDGAHVAYSKRVMARDIVGLMSALGYERFFFFMPATTAAAASPLPALRSTRPNANGGARDARHHVPTLENWEAMDYRRAYGAYHWQFLAQPEPLPERLIGSDPEWYCRQQIGAWHEDRAAPRTKRRSTRIAKRSRGPAPCTRRAKRLPRRLHHHDDVDADRADRDAGTQIEMPMLALWGAGRDGRAVRRTLPRGVGTLGGTRPDRAGATLRTFSDGRAAERNEKRTRSARSSTPTARGCLSTAATSPCAGRGARSRCSRRTAAPVSWVPPLVTSICLQVTLRGRTLRLRVQQLFADTLRR